MSPVRRATPNSSGPWSWLLVPLALLGASGVGFLLVRRPPLGLFGWSVAALLGAAIVWILVSVLWPARAERTCPACGRPGLVRSDPKAAHGLSCARCGWQDPAASSWLLAEEEGPLEDLVLAARRRRGGAERLEPVDSAAGDD